MPCPRLRRRSREIIGATAMACYTSSGSTARRIARERPPVPILVMTASLSVARRLGLQWGVHAVHTRDVTNFEEMVAKARRMALQARIAAGGDRMVVMAGVPFGQAGSTNVIHVVKVTGDELDTYAPRATAAPGSRPGFPSPNSRSGPTFFANAAPASPWSKTPHRQAAERIGAAREQAADNPRKRIAAARHAQPGAAAAIEPGAAVGGDDVALHALDQGDGIVAVGAGAAAAERIGGDIVFVAAEQRGHFAMMGEQDRRTIGAPGVLGAGGKGVEQGGVEDERFAEPREQGGERVGGLVRVASRARRRSRRPLRRVRRSA